MRRTRLAVFAGVVSVLLAAGTGLALVGDVIFTEGYDEDNQVIVWGVNETEEATYDCALTAGTYQYQTGVDGTVTSLGQGGTPVTYAGVTSTTTVNYGSTGGECDLRAVEVANENGVVNHGQVVSSFVHDLKTYLREQGVKGGVGCLVRVMAQSDYGQGDQAVHPDPTALTVPAVTSTTITGEVDLTSHELSCGKPDHAGKPDAESSGRGGRPDHAGNGNGNGNGHGHGG
ncbi:MAG: hypothetical protein ACT4OP_03445 [Actinomycetota bacterium]